MAVTMRDNGQTKIASTIMFQKPAEGDTPSHLAQVIAAYWGGEDGSPNCFYKLFPSLPDASRYNPYYPNVLLRSWTAKSGSGASSGSMSLSYISADRTF